jgi:hypothetical protein
MRVHLFCDEGQIGPCDAGDAISLIAGFRTPVQEQMQVVHPGQLDRLLGRHLEHPPSRRDRPMPDFHDHHALCR